MNGDGEPLAATADLVLVNFWLHALFRHDCERHFTHHSNNTYPYKAYIEILLSFGTESKQSKLTALVCYTDTNNFSLDQHNDGYVTRKNLDLFFVLLHIQHPGSYCGG